MRSTVWKPAVDEKLQDQNFIKKGVSDKKVAQFRYAN